MMEVKYEKSIPCNALGFSAIINQGDLSASRQVNGQRQYDLERPGPGNPVYTPEMQEGARHTGFQKNPVKGLVAFL